MIGPLRLARVLPLFLARLATRSLRRWAHAALVFASAPLANEALAQTQSDSFVVTNVRVFDGERTHADAEVAVEGGELPPYDAELVLDGKAVGRVTSAAPDRELGVVALAYVRREVPPEATLDLAGRRVTQLGA